MAVFLEIVAVLILACVGAAFFIKREGKYEREFGMIAYPRVSQSSSAPEPRLERRPLRDRSIIVIEEVVSAPERERLVEFLMDAIGIGEHADLFGSVRATATYSAMVSSIWSAISPALDASGIAAGSEVRENDPHIANAVAHLVADEKFFWFCVQSYSEIYGLYELSSILNDPDGEPIREDLLPFSRSMERLRGLYQYFYVPTNPDRTRDKAL